MGVTRKFPLNSNWLRNNHPYLHAFDTAICPPGLLGNNNEGLSIWESLNFYLLENNVWTLDSLISWICQQQQQQQ